MGETTRLAYDLPHPPHLTEETRMPRLKNVLTLALIMALLPAPNTQRHGFEGPVAQRLGPTRALAQEVASTPAPHLSTFGKGGGPKSGSDGVIRLLDTEGSHGQSNAVAFDVEHEVGRATMKMRGKMRVLEGGDGGGFAFLHTFEYGRRGPAPFVKSWAEPNLKKSFAVGVDVHNPKNEEMFGPWGNYRGMPEREISLHFDGRELVKRVAPVEFRGDWADIEIDVEHVTGGADVSVHIAGAPLYEKYFVAGLLPYEARLAIGAGTRPDATTEFDVRDIAFSVDNATPATRPPVHVEVFNHVLTDNSKTSFDAEVELPPAGFAFGRVILTLDIHDAGPNWDEWDRNGHLYVVDEDGTKYDIVPFITSYRTECHWKVDVTHFRPLLAGKTRLEIVAGTNFYKGRGYMMSVSLDFHHGQPEFEPFAVIPLWHGTAKYQSEENHFSDFFTPQTVEIPEETVAAKIATTTTGHSQIGEFVPSGRAIIVAPVQGDEREERFTDTLWKSDCYLNPNRPQQGTWKFSRAGWAPGDVVWPWWIDLTGHIEAGKTAEFRYVPQPYDFSEETQAPQQKEVNKASHVVRSFLILYRDPGALIAAPTLLVTNVAADSNAAKAGIKKGDYLASYNGVIVDSVDALSEAKAAATESGAEKIPAVIYRGTERIEIELATGQLGVNLGAR